MRVISFGLIFSAIHIAPIAPASARQSTASAADLPSRFNEAEDLARRGLYEASKKAFARVAKDFPQDELGREAAERAKENAFLKVEPIQKSGPSANRVDVILLGDGYTVDSRQQASYDKQALQIVEGFQKTAPVAEYASYFNWWKMNLSSAESRLDTPTREANTVLGGAMSKFSQGQVTVDRSTVRRFIKQYAPYADTAMAMVKQGSLGTGGGDVAVFGPGATNVAIHEFGHSFAGLLDEYTSQVELHPATGGVRGVNLTDSTDLESCPWRHWIDARTKGVGFFEGGAGRSRGVWHPTNQGCVMGSSGSAYCIVCREAFVKAIYELVRPIDSSYPTTSGVSLPADAPAIFSITPLRPKDHFLTVEWTIDGAPAKGRRDVAEGSLFEILRIEPGTIQPGSHRIVATVKDETEWVLNDEKKRLTQTREWVLELGKKP